MKKFFCFILFLSVLVGSVAIADYYTLSFTAKMVNTLLWKL